jgi:hypothetical protein
MSTFSHSGTIFCLLFFASNLSGLEIGVEAGSWLSPQMRSISFLLLISKGSGYDPLLDVCYEQHGHFYFPVCKFFF